MAFVIKDRVRETTVTTGTGPITLAGAVGGYQRFSAVMAVADTCWYAIILPGGAWETGVGTYSATNTLTRTTVLESSNAGSAVTFGAGTKDVIICLPASRSGPLGGFVSGTLMLFQQTAAPLGWTKQTTHNDKALRVVSGTASAGGTNAFSTVMAQTVVGSTTITQATMPSHTHGYQSPASLAGVGTGATIALTNNVGVQTVSTGGDGSHNHTITMSIQYVDLIIASKD